MIRNILAILSGAATGVIIMLLARIFFFILHPYPEELNWASVSDRNQYIAQLPLMAHWSMIGLHALGTFLAGLITSVIAKNRRITMGVISFSILLIFIIFNIFGYEYPLWVYLADTVVTGLFGLLGAYVGSRRAV